MIKIGDEIIWGDMGSKYRVDDIDEHSLMGVTLYSYQTNKHYYEHMDNITGGIEIGYVVIVGEPITPNKSIQKHSMV